MRRNSNVPIRCSSLHIFMVNAATRKMSKIGIHIAEELEKTRRDFVIVDLDNKVFNEEKHEFEFGEKIIGDCTNEEFGSVS